MSSSTFLPEGLDQERAREILSKNKIDKFSKSQIYRLVKDLAEP